jgi:hypothetical protein
MKGLTSVIPVIFPYDIILYSIHNDFSTRLAALSPENGNFNVKAKWTWQ